MISNTALYPMRIYQLTVDVSTRIEPIMAVVLASSIERAQQLFSEHGGYKDFNLGHITVGPEVYSMNYCVISPVTYYMCNKSEYDYLYFQKQQEE